MSNKSDDYYQTLKIKNDDEFQLFNNEIASNSQNE
jgi:hypothetical protein